MSKGEPTTEPTTLGIDYPQREDRRTHIERIDPLPEGESAAWLPHAAQWHAPGSNPELEPAAVPAEGDRKRYMLMEQAYLDGVIVRAGETVWLYDHEVGPHHVLIADDENRAETEGETGEASATETPPEDKPPE